MANVSADLVLIGGKVLTMNPAQPRAKAVAVSRDKIVKVGTDEEITRLIGRSTEVIRLNGKTVLPGFTDTHIHVADLGRLLTWVDLCGVESIESLKRSIEEHVRQTPAGRWIMGRGWDQNCLAEKRLPTRDDLDEVSPEGNPVILYHQSGQLCVVNSRALKLAGITKHTSAPAEGMIDKYQETGEPTGVLRDAATNLVWNIVPVPSEEELTEAAALACKKTVAAGVTGVHWMVLYSAELSIIRRLSRGNKLPLRVYLIVPFGILDLAAILKLRGELKHGMVRVGGVEISADGYLAARTAALFQPYNDCPDSSGRLLSTQEEMTASAARILRAGLQLVVHAVGDRAVDAALSAIEETSEETEKHPRARIEQAAVLNDGLIERMKRQKVVVSVQPRVIESEFSVWSAVNRLGAERARWLYPLKRLLKQGVRIVGGSDCPMEPLSPLLGIQAAVTREFFPGERLAVEEALRLYTVDAAYSSFEENVKGSIEEGKLADIAVLSCDPLTVLPNKIGQISVELTIIGGKIVYSRH